MAGNPNNCIYFYVSLKAIKRLNKVVKNVLLDSRKVQLKSKQRVSSEKAHYVRRSGITYLVTEIESAT